jgi:hypothetical protein
MASLGFSRSRPALMMMMTSVCRYAIRSVSAAYELVRKERPVQTHMRMPLYPWSLSILNAYLTNHHLPNGLPRVAVPRLK